MVKAIVFDLDGTLLDTILDIAASVNYALASYNLPQNSVDDYRGYVGNGMRALIERSIHNVVSDDVFLKILNLYNETYHLHSCDRTRPFPNALLTLKKIKEKGYILAVISNKPDYDSNKIINHYFPNLFDYVSGSKENCNRKPDKMALVNFSHEFKLAKNEIIYVGDSRVDASFSENFGCEYFLMTYGYEKKEILASFSPKAFLNDISELLKYL